jgi:putative ABC transport system ATP-binding protein
MARSDARSIAFCDRVGRQFDVRGETVLALVDVDLEVPARHLVAIAGPSGSGKSTLLALLGCLDRPTTGSVRVAEHELTLLGRRARRGLRRSTVATMLPQPADNLLLDRSGTDNLAVAARHRRAGTGGIAAVVESIGIGAFVDRACSTMSGGEQQRIALGCALVGGTPLVLADEPTGALDAVSAAQVVDALTRAAAAGATIVVATHDPHVIEAADVVVRLDHGRRVS